MEIYVYCIKKLFPQEILKEYFKKSKRKFLKIRSRPTQNFYIKFKISFSCLHVQNAVDMKLKLIHREEYLHVFIVVLYVSPCN